MGKLFERFGKSRKEIWRKLSAAAALRREITTPKAIDPGHAL
jgi:hypothetical protein